MGASVASSPCWTFTKHSGSFATFRKLSQAWTHSPDCSFLVPHLQHFCSVTQTQTLLQVSCLTPKDQSDVDHMLKIGLDWVALSFIQRPKDIEEIREIIASKVPEGDFSPCIMAKIEKPSCFKGDNLENVLELCNRIMVACGDLGAECPLEDVPILQKTIIDEWHCQGRPVVVAAQMLGKSPQEPNIARLLMITSMEFIL